MLFIPFILSIKLETKVNVIRHKPMEDVKDTENTFSRLLETSKTFCYYFILVLSFVVLKTIFGNWTSKKFFLCTCFMYVVLNLFDILEFDSCVSTFTTMINYLIITCGLFIIIIRVIFYFVYFRQQTVDEP
jgi:uncharacterized membrane protein